jgi:REP element-mobilizing transposase RayT
MSRPTPIYTQENCSFSCPVQWGLTVFWRTPETQDDWFSELTAATEPDGIRLLRHGFSEPGISQFAISTKIHVSPLSVVQRVKGRLQYLVRDRLPKPFRGNYAVRSVGNVTRQTAEAYVANQLGHHGKADARILARLERYQIERPEVDLSVPQRTSHGIYWYNLHIVLVHRERWTEIREEVLQRLRDMIIRASATKGYLLSRAGILADHVHFVLGCPIEVAPLDVVLGFLNNLAYVHEMRPIYEYGGFVGTVGEYTNKAINSGSSLDGNGFRGGEED